MEFITDALFNSLNNVVKINCIITLLIISSSSVAQKIYGKLRNWNHLILKNIYWLPVRTNCFRLFMWYRLSIIVFFVFVFEDVVAQLELRQAETISCGLDYSGRHNIAFSTGAWQFPKDNNSSRVQSAGAVFDVKYSGFTAEARNAFQYAIDIWARTIKSDVPIKIFANWAFLDNVTTLAFVTPTEVKNFEGTPKKDLWPSSNAFCK